MRKQNEHDQIVDRIFAAMHTGNFGQANTLLREYSAVDNVQAGEIRIDVIRVFGVDLEG